MKFIKYFFISFLSILNLAQANQTCLPKKLSKKGVAGSPIAKLGSSFKTTYGPLSTAVVAVKFGGPTSIGPNKVKDEFNFDCQALAVGQKTLITVSKCVSGKPKTLWLVKQALSKWGRFKDNPLEYTTYEKIVKTKIVGKFAALTLKTKPSGIDGVKFTPLNIAHLLNIPSVNKLWGKIHKAHYQSVSLKGLVYNLDLIPTYVYSNKMTVVNSTWNGKTKALYCQSSFGKKFLGMPVIHNGGGVSLMTNAKTWLAPVYLSNGMIYSQHYLKWKTMFKYEFSFLTKKTLKKLLAKK